MSLDNLDIKCVKYPPYLKKNQRIRLNDISINYQSPGLTITQYLPAPKMNYLKKNKNLNKNINNININKYNYNEHNDATSCCINNNDDNINNNYKRINDKFIYKLPTPADILKGKNIQLPKCNKKLNNNYQQNIKNRQQFSGIATNKKETFNLLENRLTTKDVILKKRPKTTGPTTTTPPGSNENKVSAVTSDNNLIINKINGADDGVNILENWKNYKEQETWRDRVMDLVNKQVKNDFLINKDDYNLEYTKIIDNDNNKLNKSINIDYKSKLNETSTNKSFYLLLDTPYTQSDDGDLIKFDNLETLNNNLIEIDNRSSHITSLNDELEKEQISSENIDLICDDIEGLMIPSALQINETSTNESKLFNNNSTMFLQENQKEIIDSLHDDLELKMKISSNETSKSNSNSLNNSFVQLSTLNLQINETSTSESKLINNNSVTPLTVNEKESIKFLCDNLDVNLIQTSQISLNDSSKVESAVELSTQNLQIDETSTSESKLFNNNSVIPLTDNIKFLCDDLISNETSKLQFGKFNNLNIIFQKCPRKNIEFIYEFLNIFPDLKLYNVYFFHISPFIERLKMITIDEQPIETIGKSLINTSSDLTLDNDKENHIIENLNEFIDDDLDVRQYEMNVGQEQDQEDVSCDHSSIYVPLQAPPQGYDSNLSFSDSLSYNNDYLINDSDYFASCNNSEAETSISRSYRSRHQHNNNNQHQHKDNFTIYKKKVEYYETIEYRKRKAGDYQTIKTSFNKLPSMKNLYDKNKYDVESTSTTDMDLCYFIDGKSLSNNRSYDKRATSSLSSRLFSKKRNLVKLPPLVKMKVRPPPYTTSAAHHPAGFGGDKEQGDKKSGDSAYSSLTRALNDGDYNSGGKGGEQPKFCHECGTQYPVALAKFCCFCGMRRIAI